MNPRERAVTALNHKEPDKVPLDLNGTIMTALTLVAYNNLRIYLSLEEDKDPDVSCIIVNTVRANEDILSLYEVDTRTIYMKGPSTPAKFLPDGSFYDDYGVRWRPASYYYDAIERPLENVTTISDLKKAKWEKLYDKARVKGVREKTKNLYENTGYCLVADTHSWGPFEGGCVFRGYENFLTDLYYNVNFAIALLDKITETCIANWDMFLNEVGEYVQVVANGDDVGMQEAPYISPEMYRKFIKPLHKRIFDFIHSKTKAKIFFHSCGSVYDLIPDFIEEGVDILNPIQRSAAKMDIKTIKKEFGKDLCFWGGGIDIQKQLPFYTQDEIEEEVKRTLDIMAPGGGFVFFPTHNIQADVTPDRIDCLFKTVVNYRDYKNFNVT